MKKTLEIGDFVVYCPCFGAALPTAATIEAMDITEHPREKYGEEVDEVSIDDVRANRVVFNLSGNRWCYSEQIDVEATFFGRPRVPVSELA